MRFRAVGSSNVRDFTDSLSAKNCMTNNTMLRYHRLDGLRFVAISLVLFEHFGWRGESVLLGYYGVDLFFVISGFLITGILLRAPDGDQGSALVRFFGRRALRIFPPYYLLLVVLLAFNIEPAREMSVSLFTYTFNYATFYKGAHGENPLFYLWSLSVEEQFYIVWPFLILGLKRRKRVLTGLILAVVALGYSQILWNIVPSMERFNYTGLFNRMGSLGLGAFGAVYVAWMNPPRAMFLNRWIELACLAILLFAVGWDSAYRCVLMGLGSLFFVIKAAKFRFQTPWLDDFMTHRAVVYVGMISYGIYLFHVPLGIAFTEHLFDPVWKAIPFGEFGQLEKLRWHSWVVKVPLYGGLSIAIAAASHRWFESPILRLKDRWFPMAPKTAIVAD
jgi:peptidoglycan/LPS O-acetylase OafA/YrhL